MDNTKKIYDRLKAQYEDFQVENSTTKSPIKYITELNFLKKMEEFVVENNLEPELEFIKSRKELILIELEKLGIKPKTV